MIKITYAKKGQTINGFVIPKDGWIILNHSSVLAYGFSTKRKAISAYKFAF